MDPKRNEPPKKPDGDDKKPKNLLTTIIVSIAILLVVISIFNFVNDSQYTETTYSQFLDEMDKNNIAEADIHNDRVIYMTREEAAKPAGSQRPAIQVFL